MEIRSEGYVFDIDEYPDECPFCHFAIHLNRHLCCNSKGEELELVFCCPKCDNLFISKYLTGSNFQENIYFFQSSYPRNIEIIKPNPIISRISKQFYEIYNQAIHADQLNLNYIAGAGLRKALEFLVKDFCVHNNPDKEQEIKNLPLQNCINNYISRISPIIQNSATLSYWLGNDESHYIRKYPEKNINDLKKLINITLHNIVCEIEPQEFRKEMEK